jgi:hypothetical protein
MNSNDARVLIYVCLSIPRDGLLSILLLYAIKSIGISHGVCIINGRRFREIGRIKIPSHWFRDQLDWVPASINPVCMLG